MEKTIAVTELAKHTKASDCWIAINGRVYDVTSWLPDHPGGVELVVDISGKDATEDFNDVGHSEFAHDLRKKYEVGVLEGATVNDDYVSRFDPSTTGKREEKKGGNWQMIAGIVVAGAALGYYLLKKKK